MSNAGVHKHWSNRGLMVKLGIEAPDTPFNRRAAEYAKSACAVAAQAAYLEKKAADKKPPNDGQ